VQHAVGKRDIQVERLLAELDSREVKIHQLESSTSWRITAPLRWIRKALTPRTWKVVLGRGVKSSYEKLPQPMHRRLALKGKVFRALAPLIRNTRSFRAWQAFEAHRSPDGAATVLRDSPVVSSSPSLQHSSHAGTVEFSSLAGHVLNELPSICLSSTRSPRMMLGGAAALPSGLTSPRPCRNSSGTISRACPVSSVSTI
jgi:hypothetical protein